MSLDPLVNICRLCGSKSKLLIGVFSPEGEKLTLERKIRMCLPITVSSEDNMPKQVCHPCLQKLETSYELYLKCNAAQNIIKNLLKFQTVNNTPKTCFIEQVEREKISENGSNDVRSVEIHMPPPTLAVHTQGQPTHMPPPTLTVHTQGQPMQMPPSTLAVHNQGQPIHMPPSTQAMHSQRHPFPNHSSFNESAPVLNRFPLQNGYSMSRNVVEIPQPSISNASELPRRNSTDQVGLLSDFSPVGRIRSKTAEERAGRVSLSDLLRSQNPVKPKEPIALSDLAPVGMLRPAPPFQALSNLQSVGQVRPVSQVRPIPQVNAFEPTHPPPQNSNPPAEPVDSKENIVLNKRGMSAKPTGAEKPLKSATSKAAKTTVTPAPVPPRKPVEKSKSGLDCNVAIVPEPMVAMCHTETLDPNLAEPGTAVVLVDSNDELDPLGDDSCDITDIIEPGASAAKRLRNDPEVEVACKYCGKMFTENVITLHQNLHLRQKFFTCVSCDKNFTTNQALDRHKCIS